MTINNTPEELRDWEEYYDTRRSMLYWDKQSFDHKPHTSVIYDLIAYQRHLLKKDLKFDCFYQDY